MNDSLPWKVSKRPPGPGNGPRRAAARGPRIGSPGSDDDAPPDRPDAVLLDAGDLGPVERLMAETGVRFEHIRVTRSAQARWPHPKRLLVMSAQLALRLPLPSLSPDDPVTAIALAQDGAGTATAQLARLGFRYRVGPGVHVEALRLLIDQALFRGHEQRQSPRLPLGAEVSWRQGWRRQHGTLVEISEQGARLHARNPLEAGQRLELAIPERFTRGERLGLPARILRVENTRSREVRRPHVMALRWAPRSEREESGLQDLLHSCRSGPLAAAHCAAEISETCANTSAEADRRGLPRSRFDREVLTLDAQERVEYALLGHDISCSGMRVRADSGLGLGQRLRVALYDSASEGALLLEAVVARDDGPRGLALRFVEVSPHIGDQLREFIEKLPAIHSLQPRPERVVMGQLLRSA